MRKKIKTKEIKLTLIVPNTGKQTKRRVMKIAKDIDILNWRHKYPKCPKCGARGEKGLTPTKLGNHYSSNGSKVDNNCLRCRSCNNMFTYEHDAFWNIKVGQCMGD